MPAAHRPQWVRVGQNRVLLSNAALRQLRNNKDIARAFYTLTRNCKDPHEFTIRINEFVYNLRQKNLRWIDQNTTQANRSDLTTMPNMQAELNNPSSLASMFAVEAAAAVTSAVVQEMENVQKENTTATASSDNTAMSSSGVTDDLGKIAAVSTVIDVWEGKAPEEIFRGFEKEDASKIKEVYEKITGEEGKIEDFLKSDFSEKSEIMQAVPKPPMERSIEDEEEEG